MANRIKYNEEASRWELIDASGELLDYAQGTADDNPWDLIWQNIVVRAGNSLSTTANGDCILEGYTAVSKGSLITGTIEVKGNPNITPSASRVSLDAGYYKDGITVAGDSYLIPGNIKDGVTIFGVTGTLKEGSDITLPTGIDVQPEHVLAGKFYIDADGIKQEGEMPVHRAKNVTLTTSEQTLPAGYYESVTVPGSVFANLTASQIELATFDTDAVHPDYYFITSLGEIKQGTMRDNGIVEVELRDASYELPSGYYGGITIPARPSVPTTNLPSLAPSDIRYGLEVPELGITGTFTYVDRQMFAPATSDVILPGYAAYVDGKLVEGAMAGRTDTVTIRTNNEVYSADKETVIASNGVYEVNEELLFSLSVEVEKPSSGDIRKGATLFGVDGTYEGEGSDVDLSVVTATENQVLLGYTFIDKNGDTVSGTMLNNGTLEVTLIDSEQTFGAGYYGGITIPAKPAEAETYSGMYIVTPKEHDIELETAGKLMAQNLCINGDPNLSPEYIKDGVTIFDITGEYKGDSIDLTGISEPDAAVVPEGFTFIGNLNGSPVSFPGEAVRYDYEFISVDDLNDYIDTDIPGIITYLCPNGFHQGTSVEFDLSSNGLTAGNIKDGVTICGVTGTFTADADATAADILAGKTAYVKGKLVEGTLVVGGDSGGSQESATPTPGAANVVLYLKYVMDGIMYTESYTPKDLTLTGQDRRWFASNRDNDCLTLRYFNNTWHVHSEILGQALYTWGGSSSTTDPWDLDWESAVHAALDPVSDVEFKVFVV